MKLGDFIKKWNDNASNEVKILEEKKKKLQWAIGDINLEIMDTENKNNPLSNIILAIVLVSMLASSLSYILYYEAFTNATILLVLVLVGVNYLNDKSFNNRKKEKVNHLRKKQSDIEKEIDEYENIIKHNNDVINEVKKAKIFFEKNNRTDFLEKEIPLTEEQVLFYIHRKMSIPTISYLSMMGYLKDTSILDMTNNYSTNLNKLAESFQKLIDIKPDYFFDFIYRIERRKMEKKIHRRSLLNNIGNEDTKEEEKTHHRRR